MSADALSELLASIRSDADEITAGLSAADLEVMRDVRLAAESLDDAACHMRRLRHQKLRTLFNPEES